MSDTTPEESSAPYSLDTQGEGRIGTAGRDGRMKKAAPFALVVDDQESVARVVSIVLAGLGVESASYLTAKAAIAAFDERRPDIIFLDVALEQSDAIDVINGLRGKNYTGIVQLMSGGKQPLLEALQRLGARHGLTLPQPLRKPFRGDAIREAIFSAGIAPDASHPSSPTPMPPD